MVMGKMGKALGRIGGQLAFNMYLEVWRPEIISGLRDFLEYITPQKARQMVQSGELIQVDPKHLPRAKAYLKYMKQITSSDLFEAIVEARQDIAEVIASFGEDGRLYMKAVRRNLLTQVAEAPDILPEAAPPGVPPETVTAKCDKCEGKWPVKKADIQNLVELECPFCHQVQPIQADNIGTP